MFNTGVQSGLIARNPFSLGPALITSADEIKRDRVLSLSEEEALLATCTGARAHLHTILILALDTGMRRGEIFKLHWPDIDFKQRLLTVRWMNAKSLRERQIAMTS